ncbi:hypothetical protein ABL78_6667 [Leptomonas seymouri]|uniref:BCNT-C domain-containing protein n=1 Tax=Leptomonas seymouri TaxID=5684 RepID=A0A0N0P3L7_LEPSE|nr:hypothetical protein ABL78_6667 [Leptomonas seymouri]|eukprot:KPI84276.1 hypothetical protein ABL78_6667 [Leptomonas seymouri]
MSDTSDADSAASLSTDASRASSLDSAPASLPHRYGAEVTRGEPVEVARLRLQREQRLRRMLSQRHLGQPEALSRTALLCTRSALSEEDTVWLYALTNHSCFERLLREVEATPSSIAGHLDAILSNANPLFHFNYGMPIEAPHCTAGMDEAVEENSRDLPFLRQSPLMRQWSSERCVIRRKRPAPEEQATSSPAFQEAGTGRAGALKKNAKKTSSTSASSGLVAQSMMAWEAHLASSLTREGETIENFRQARSKSSYTEKKAFQQQAEWNEFTREVALQQQQRDREATRALRRGEVDE